MPALRWHSVHVSIIRRELEKTAGLMVEAALAGAEWAEGGWKVATGWARDSEALVSSVSETCRQI